MPTTSVIEFSDMIRHVTNAAKCHSFVVPSFRSPPRRQGALRTVRHLAGGAALISVAIQGRSRLVVLDDLIEGVIVTNSLVGSMATSARQVLRLEIEPFTSEVGDTNSKTSRLLSSTSQQAPSSEGKKEIDREGSLSKSMESTSEAA